MSAPSVPRCGRMDEHEPHEWYSPVFRYDCPGRVVTEGAQPCVTCQRPRAICRCADELAQSRNDEWWSE